MSPSAELVYRAQRKMDYVGISQPQTPLQYMLASERNPRERAATGEKGASANGNSQLTLVRRLVSLYYMNERVPVLRTGGDLEGNSGTGFVPAHRVGSKLRSTANKSTKLIRQILARGPVPSAETRAPNGLHEETR